MNPETLISIITSLLAVFCSLAALLRNARRDTAGSATAAARTTVLLETIQSGVEEIRLEQRAVRQDVIRLSDRLTRTEGRLKSSTHRLEGLERRELHGTEHEYAS